MAAEAVVVVVVVAAEAVVVVVAADRKQFCVLALAAAGPYLASLD